MTDYKAIPAELQRLPHWVNWGSYGKDWNAPGTNTRERKIPRSPGTGSNAKADAPETWGSFSAAVANIGKWAEGIGFEFGKDPCGVVGVDFDHCIDPQTGEISPAVLHWVEALNSYTEISPSGTGLHVLCCGQLPGEGKKRPWAELYDRRRYFTVTGQAIRGQPLRNAQKAINDLYKALAAETERPARAQPEQAAGFSSLDNTDYLQVGLANDEKLRALWYGGRPNGNESADDMALMNKLAYWCNCEPAAMQAAFLQSPHFQSKDEDHKRKADPDRRPDYMARTIQAAVQGCQRTAAEKDAAYKSQRQHPARSPYKGQTERSTQTEGKKTAFLPFHPFEEEQAPKLPAFPVNALPSALGAYVAAVAESLQVSPDMAAVSVLGVLAAACQGSFTICPKPDWEEQLNLFLVVVARPSERKSPTLKLVTGAANCFIREENERRAADIREYELQKRVLTKRAAALVEKAGKPTGGRTKQAAAEQLATEEELRAVQNELAELAEIKSFRMFADDTTPEALVSLMAENGGKMAVMSAEAGLFSILAGQYSDGTPNIANILKAYTGELIQVDRKGRAAETVETPALTILQLIQPGPLRELVANRTFADRGFLARFLYALPESTVGQRRYNSQPIPAEVAAAYADTLRPLLQLQAQNKATELLYLSEGATEVFKSFCEGIEPRLVDDLEDVEAWTGKLCGQVARLAGCLHCAINGQDAAAELVSAGTMQAAVQIGLYFLEHSKYVFRTAGNEAAAAVKDAKYIWKRLQTTAQPDISKRALFNLCKGRLPTMEQCTPGLDELARRGYVRIVKQSTGGRPSETVEINPEAAAAAQKKTAAFPGF